MPNSRQKRHRRWLIKQLRRSNLLERFKNL
jgi:hypothetical protein